MKSLSLICLLILSSLGIAQAQGEPTFSVAIPADTILLGNYFEVKFSLNNAEGKSFSPPSFEGFEVVGGPNQSSSLSVINGEATQSLAYGYYLKPQEVGNYFIEPASIEADGIVMETMPTEIIVLPNPDNTQVDYLLRSEQEFNFWGSFGREQPRIIPEPAPKPEKKKKKKRKIYRL